MDTLNDKVVVVTGGASGIGLALLGKVELRTGRPTSDGPQAPRPTCAQCGSLGSGPFFSALATASR